MGINKAAAMIALAKQKAENGVDFSPRRGALCPSCHGRAKIYSTKPWEGSVRVRYHRCENTRCCLNTMGVTIKSIEEDVAA